MILSALCVQPNVYVNNVHRTASINIGQTEANPGNTASVTVVANAFENINTFESRIVFNPEVLEFTAISDLHPAISNASYNLIGDSIFALNWIGFPAQHIDDGVNLFTLNFQFCCNMISCAENETISHVNVVENTAYIGRLNPNFTFTQIELGFTNGAVFSPVPLRIFTLDQTGSGTVFVNDNPYTNPIAVEENTEITLDAQPVQGYEFSHWSGGINDDENPLTFVIISDVHVTANFIPETFILTATAGQGGIINPVGMVSANWDSDLTFTITPDTGYQVADVLVDGTSVGTPEKYTFSNITADHTIHASFEPVNGQPPGNLFLQGITIENLMSVCFEAQNTIEVAGNHIADFFVVENGGEAWLIAGESIRMLPGTKVENGGYLNAFISADGVFCPVKSIAYNDDVEHQAAENIFPGKPGTQKQLPLFKIYPNPASNNVTIQPIDLLGNDEVQMEIFSIMGELVKKTLLSGANEYVIDISGWQKGMYLVRLVALNQTDHQRLIIN